MTLIEKARRNRIDALARLSPEASNIFAERRSPRRPRPSTLPNFLARGIDGIPAREKTAPAQAPVHAVAPVPQAA